MCSSDLNASGEASRKAAVVGSDADIELVVKSLTGTLDQTRLTIAITPDASQRKHGVEVSVVTHYENRLITPIIGGFFENGAADLASKTVMRVE